jgi:quercetin dioxygenase-like cupin family protein
MTDSASPFRTWNGIESWQFADGVRLHAIGGEQILVCRVTYEPGTEIPDHTHEHTEQVMAIVDGAVTLTVDGETRDVEAGDVIVINKGVPHSLSSENGVTFFEALAPVPLDHVPDRERDLVLAADAGRGHVER